MRLRWARQAAAGPYLAQRDRCLVGPQILCFSADRFWPGRNLPLAAQPIGTLRTVADTIGCLGYTLRTPPGDHTNPKRKHGIWLPVSGDAKFRPVGPLGMRVEMIRDPSECRLAGGTARKCRLAAGSTQSSRS